MFCRKVLAYVSQSKVSDKSIILVLVRTPSKFLVRSSTQPGITAPGRLNSGQKSTFLKGLNWLDLTSWVQNCPAIFAACYHSLFLSHLSCLSSLENEPAQKNTLKVLADISGKRHSPEGKYFNRGFVTSEATLEPKD